MGEIIEGSLCPHCKVVMEYWKSSYHVEGCQRYIYGHTCYSCQSEYTEDELALLKLKKIASAMNVAIKLYIDEPSDILLAVLDEYRKLNDSEST